MKRCAVMNLLKLCTIAAAVEICCSGSAAMAEAAGQTQTGESLIPGEVAVNEGKILTVGYVMIGAESDWRLACNKSIREAFTRENGYSLLISDAQQKHEKQIKAVREFINQEVDYILFNPIVESGWEASLEEAAEAGIPVIGFDREVDVKAKDACTTWIGSDFLLEGRKACAWLEAYLESTGYEDSLGLVHIQGTMGSSAQIGRTRALDEALAGHPEWKLLDRQSGDFTTAKGKEVMVDMLAGYGDEIQAVYCENDNEAYGAIEAIREAGRIPGPDIASGEILVLSFDAARNGLLLTLTGQIAVNTECAPEYGPLLTQIISRLEGGDKLPARQYVQEAQFSALEHPAEIYADGQSYPVIKLTEDLIESRSY